MRTIFKQAEQAALDNGWLLQRDLRQIDGIKYRYTLNDNQGFEAVCRDLDEVYDVIWEWSNKIA